MMSTWNKRLVLIVTGGIAAYKTPEIARRARAAGAEVRVVMTRAAGQFITPMSLQAVSGNPVHLELFDAAAEAAMGHIELARWADLVLVAPASADFLARLAHGLADDLAATLCLATAAPIWVAPAMNRLMWDNAATRANCQILEARGVRFIGPDAGEQACGEVGPGRMSEPERIMAVLAAPAVPGELAGVRVMVTAGPTQEPIDPVRFITNRSSGKMGYAIAAAAAAAGALVTLVSGPTALAPPAGVTVRRVTTAAEMFEIVTAEIAAQDIFIAAAAVADYRAAAAAAQKMKKAGEALTLTLVPTQDILRAVAGRQKPPFTVGFAAETEHVLENARSKLAGKSLDMIAANNVGQAGIGFDSDANELHVIWGDGETQLGRAPKNIIARRLVELIAARYRAAHA